MKKFILIILSMLCVLTLIGCGNVEGAGSQTKKLLGDIAPKPIKKYEVISTFDDSIYLVVRSASEEDFEAYVESCYEYGFDGYIKTATSPDKYFMEYNDDGYYLEIMYYKDQAHFSIYIRKPNQNL